MLKINKTKTIVVKNKKNYGNYQILDYVSVADFCAFY